MGGLFSAIVVGGVEVPNRIVMPPMTTQLADDEGHVTDALLAYYKARALGGAGLITVEMGSPEKAGRHRFRELGIYDDRFLPGLERLTTSQEHLPSAERGRGGDQTRREGVAALEPRRLRQADAGAERPRLQNGGLCRGDPGLLREARAAFRGAPETGDEVEV